MDSIRALVKERFVIAIVVGNVFIPIAWIILPKEAKSENSNALQRKRFTKKLLSIFLV